jgi:hypothetical protein
MMRQRAMFCKLISPREIDFGWRTVIARKCDSTRKTEFMREGKDDEGFCARLRMRTQGKLFSAE